MAKSVLGRGMGALLEMEEVSTAGSSSFGEIELEKIHPNPNQPRAHFDEDALCELAASIKSVGVIQPITVRKQSDDSYQIIAGERRFRASKKAGLLKIPAYIKTAEDEQVMQMALVENIQREDLNAIEVALSYHRLVEEYKLTQEKLSELVGKKRATVANYIRLLKLPAEIQLGITVNKIDMGHARALINIDDPELQLQVYNDIVKHQYTVREVEDIVRAIKNADGVGLATKQDRTQKVTNDAYELARKELTAILQTKVDVVYNETGKGKLILPFNSEQELNRLMVLLSDKK